MRRCPGKNGSGVASSYPQSICTAKGFTIGVLVLCPVGLVSRALPMHSSQPCSSHLPWLLGSLPRLP